MALHPALEPLGGPALIQNGLKRLLTGRGLLSTRKISFDSLQIHQPHSVYDLKVDALVSGGGLESTTATGYRYLINDGEADIAAAELRMDATGTAALLANINYGRFVEATAVAIRQVNMLKSVREGSFEIRLLRCSPIGLMSLWLISDPAGADIVYPLVPAPDGLLGSHPYSTDDFIKSLISVVQQRILESGPTGFDARNQ
jgi:hypothetical protein